MTAIIVRGAILYIENYFVFGTRLFFEKAKTGSNSYEESEAEMFYC